MTENNLRWYVLKTLKGCGIAAAAMVADAMFRQGHFFAGAVTLLIVCAAVVAFIAGRSETSEKLKKK